MRIALLKQFYNRVTTQPDSVALDIDGRTLSYEQLWRISFRNADTLKSALQYNQEIHHRSKVPVVALHLGKSNEFVVAQLACWMAGAAFLPLDIDWPEQRKHLAIMAAKCQVLAFGTGTEPSDSSLNTHIKELHWPDISDQSANSAMDVEVSLLHKINHADQLAYVIFTSGSSGEPKGVAISFSGLTNIFHQQADIIGLQSSDRMLWLHHVCFDASIADVWVTLLAGGRLVANTALKPLSTLDFIAVHGIAYVDLPASLMSLLPPDVPEHLKTVLVGGEVTNLAILKAWHQKVKVIIAYGPSEATICTSMHVFNGEETQSGYIGEPINGVDYLVVDAKGEPVKQGEVGELIIVGQAVALGYLNAKAADQSRFFQIDNQRAYRTGDLVKKTSANYRFYGRADRQFKLNGKLLCPEEVEQALLEHPQVSEAYVFTNHKQNSAEYWVAVSTRLKQSELVHWIEKYLPKWMCSPKWLLLPSLPRNANGKVDQYQLISQGKSQLTSSESTSLVEILQKYVVTDIVLETKISELPIDSIDWLRVIINLRENGSNIDAGCFYNLLNCADATVADMESITTDQTSNASVGKKSSELLEYLSCYPELELSLSDNGFSDHNAVLVTGATGHLGGLLLSELLKTNRTVFCLVRQGSPSLSKLKTKFRSAFKEGELQLIFSDITKPRFGLEHSHWNDLAEVVTDVYHCAADTSVVKPLEELIPTNVAGSYHVLQFCAYKSLKRLHYASTLALVVDSDWKTKSVDEKNTLSSGCFYGGYAQSKWLAEQLVQRYPLANIFRLGLLVGDPNDSGALESDLFNLRLNSVPAMSQPSRNECFDFTPSDQAAALMCLIAQHSKAGVYHIHNPKAVSATFLNNTLVDADIEVSNCHEDDTNDPYRIYKMTNVRIGSESTQEFVASLNAQMPSASKQRIVAYIKAVRS
jgi:nonribosomal peptide synthetase DhbF